MNCKICKKSRVSYVACLQQLCPYFVYFRGKVSEFLPLTFVQVALVRGILPPLF